HRAYVPTGVDVRERCHASLQRLSRSENWIHHESQSCEPSPGASSRSGFAEEESESERYISLRGTEVVEERLLRYDPERPVETRSAAKCGVQEDVGTIRHSDRD